MSRMVSLGPDFPGVLGKIIEVVYHPKFSTQYDYDFCLLMIDRDIEYNEAVQPICMVDHEETMPPDETDLFVAGWGKTETGSQSRFLKEALVPLQGNDLCNAQEGYRGFAKPESMFCAGYQKGGIDACQGDSGGPIVQGFKKSLFLELRFATKYKGRHFLKTKLVLQTKLFSS